MRAAVQVPAAADLLNTWERGLHAAPARRALLVLAATCPAMALPELAGLPVGQRNRLLLHARSLLFGEDCDAVAGCPRCGAELEARLPVSALLARPETGDRPTEGELAVAGYQVRYRVPTGADLAEVAERTPGSVAAAAGELFDRCVQSVRRDGAACADGDLPAEVIGAVAAAVSSADPDAVVEVEVVCPVCERQASLALDPAAFLWAELDQWAWQVLREVTDLAAAYGWDEAAILALSPWRRQAYLALSAAGGARRLKALADLQ